MKNIIVGQSGGPTSAINASLYGVIAEAFDHSEEIGHVYGMVNGIEGFLQDNIIDLTKYAKKYEISYMKNTPSSFLGSCRFKLSESLEEEVYGQIFEKLEKYDIGAFVYIGGNDSMDTVAKLSTYAAKIGSSIRFIGVPKTIDNDLVMTDHTPGYGSTIKYIATTLREIILDAGVYDMPVVTIVELMGRHAGWVTAGSVLARTDYDKNPMLVYLPEGDFDVDQFIEDVKKALTVQNSVVVCVSEGISDKEGVFICEYGDDVAVDGFGHKMLAGCGKVLERLVKDKIGCKCRSIEFNLSQRCSANLASLSDITEAEMAGRFGVKSALNGETGKMAALVRDENSDEYKLDMALVDVTEVCNQEKKFPEEWITDNGTNIAEEYLAYAMPLIQGECQVPYENGLPQYAVPAYKNPL